MKVFRNSYRCFLVIQSKSRPLQVKRREKEFSQLATRRVSHKQDSN